MYGRPIPARPLIAGHFWLGQVGTQPIAPPPGPQCPPGQFWDGTQCRGSIGTIPGGAPGLPNLPPVGGGPLPAGNQAAAPQASNCNVPAGYEPAPGGGAKSPDNVAWACPLPNGTYNVINARSMAPVQSGVSRACLDQYGDVTQQPANSPVCGGGPARPASSEPCALQADKLFILCPPSNGITLPYTVDARTGAYTENMTTQSPACADSKNVIKVQATSPYCSGGNVGGPGDALPSLVGCLYSPGNTYEEILVTLYNGLDMAMLEQKIMLKDIPVKYPGRRYMFVTGLFCTKLPDFGQAAPAPAPPAPAPAPAPAPVPAPVTVPTAQTPATQPLITTPGAAPLTYPITNMWFPESLEPPPISPVGGLLPIVQTYAPPQPPAPRPYVPGQPLPVTDWFGICAQRARGL